MGGGFRQGLNSEMLAFLTTIAVQPFSYLFYCDISMTRLSRLSGYFNNIHVCSEVILYTALKRQLLPILSALELKVEENTLYSHVPLLVSRICLFIHLNNCYLFHHKSGKLQWAACSVAKPCWEFLSFCRQISYL